MDASLPLSLERTALAFRGYNFENLGRTPELLADPRYGPLLREELEGASAHAARLLRRPVDLLQFVEQKVEPPLAQYGEAVAMILATSAAQLRCLEEVHQVDWRRSMLLMGYSLGEISALVAGGTLELGESMAAPLPLADDVAALAEGVKLAVLFNRRTQLDMHQVQRAMLETNLEQDGVMGVSAVLSPNSLLMMGQGTTLGRFYDRLKAAADDRIHLRRNEHRWPPIHTPIVLQRDIPSRAARLMLGMRGGLQPPDPPVLSLVTGETSYTDINVRETLYRWIEQRQHLWTGIYELLSRGVETVVHVGPAPNIVPATMHRLSDNVEAQARGSLGVRALKSLVSRPWLQALLPQRAALLRAPQVNHLVLEDWLLEN